jgi:hypothetical protein
MQTRVLVLVLVVFGAMTVVSQAVADEYLPTERVATDASQEATSGSADRFQPPEGSESMSELQTHTEVSGKPGRLKRWAGKPAPESAATVRSNSGDTAIAMDWYELGFASSRFTPQPGVDPRLRAAAVAYEKDGEESVYGFLLMDEFLTSATQAELEALGATVLGPHSSAYKVRLPADSQALDAIVDLPYVEWIGFSLPEQKVAADFHEVLASSPEPAQGYPVVINLFAADAQGRWADKLTALGVTVGRFDTDLTAYRVLLPMSVLDSVIDFDWVLYVEPVRPTIVAHDQSQPLIGADYIRPGSGLTSRFDGAPVILGIMDTGFMLGTAASTPHVDLNKNGCGSNFTTSTVGVWDDQHGHGTHVLGTIIGTGAGDSRFKGVATGVGGSGSTRIRAAKVFAGRSGNTAWTEAAMDWMDDATACGSPRPDVINFSGGGGPNNQVGTDSTSRKADAKTLNGQLYVIAAGNSGPNAGTVKSPGVAKSTLTAANVFDFSIAQVGDVNSWDATQCAANNAANPCASSRGPTGDNRMKPNLSAPGTFVTSADAGTTDGYRATFGTSMAAPHVAGLALTLMDHYPTFKGKPYMTRAWLMASSLLHDDMVIPSDNDAPASGDRTKYGIGRISSYAAHWGRSGANGWSGHFASGTVDSGGYTWQEVDVPAGTSRLVVVMTWDEPAASAGASAAVTDDVDLWIDRDADCTGEQYPGACGEYASISRVDNVEYVIIEAPPSGTYRLKAAPWNVSAPRSFGFGTMVIRGDTTPQMTFATIPSTLTPALDTDFTITSTITNTSWIASGVHLARLTAPIGIDQQSLITTREDNVTMDFGTETEVTLGNIREGDSRTATWTLRANSVGLHQLIFSAWSENGGIEPGNVLICPADSWEPDDTSAQAQVLGQGPAPVHSLCLGTDVDWAQFTLPGESAITLDSFGSAPFTRMRLFDSTLAELESDEGAGVKATLKIDRTCALDPLPGGTYYVQVDATDSNPVGFYTLTLTIDESCGCVDELTLENDTLTGTQTHVAGTGITLGPALTIDGAQIDVLAGEWVAMTSGIEIGGSFSAGTQANACR